MLRKAFLTIVVVTVIALCLGGCKKSSDESSVEPPQPAPRPVKTMTQHEADAKKEITAENLEEELAKLEKAVEDDIVTDVEP